MCRTALIRSALENAEVGTFNGGADVEIRTLGTDLVMFEVASAGGAPNNSGTLWKARDLSTLFRPKCFFICKSSEVMR